MDEEKKKKGLFTRIKTKERTIDLGEIEEGTVKEMIALAQEKLDFLSEDENNEIDEAEDLMKKDIEIFEKKIDQRKKESKDKIDEIRNKYKLKKKDLEKTINILSPKKK